MAVWEFIMVASSFSLDAALTEAHLECPEDQVNAALNYYRALKDEIDQALADNDPGQERLSQSFPHLRILSLPASDEA